jgi:hypothetical protein
LNAENHNENLAAESIIGGGKQAKYDNNVDRFSAPQTNENRPNYWTNFIS